MSTVPSSTNRPRQLLSSSYIEHREKITKGHSHFWRQNFKGGWITVPKGTAEHKSRLASLEDTIDMLQTRGK